MILVNKDGSRVYIVAVVRISCITLYCGIIFTELFCWISPLCNRLAVVMTVFFKLDEKNMWKVLNVKADHTTCKEVVDNYE